MKYEGSIYRPPSEAYSLLIQVSIGCSHNKCTFCSMYQDKQFYLKPQAQIMKELKEYEYKDEVTKVFLCDGDALVLKYLDFVEILTYLNEEYHNLKRVSCYATFQDLENKSIEQLKHLQQLGLKLIYLGAESGDDNVLLKVNKGVDTKRMIDAHAKAKQAGLKTSVMIISGLGGQEYYESHAYQSAMLLNKFQPPEFYSDFF